MVTTSNEYIITLFDIMIPSHKPICKIRKNKNCADFGLHVPQNSSFKSHDFGTLDCILSTSQALSLAYSFSLYPISIYIPPQGCSFIMSSLKHVCICLLGVGNVGKAVLRQVLDASERHAARNGVSFSFVALTDSSGIAATSTLLDTLTSATSSETTFDLADICLSKAECESLLSWKTDSKKFAEHKENGAKHLSSLADLICRVGDAVTAAGAALLTVDCTATDATVPALLRTLTAYKRGGIVLANKKPVTVDQKHFDVMLAPENAARVGLESTVGAGTPMVAAVRRLLDSGDDVHKISGSLSGTLGYVTTGLEQGQSYSSVVKDAFDKGYTEPDPRDDLSGTDVARKALIMARLLGWKLEMSDVSIEPLYASHMASLSVPDFIAALGQLDEEYQARVTKAKAENKVLRYVAVVQDTKCSVGLRALDTTAALGQLKGTQNMAAFDTRVYDSSPLVVQGAGAGAEVTAAGVIADMVVVAAAL
jgi:homoserine dehydrogenase